MSKRSEFLVVSAALAASFAFEASASIMDSEAREKKLQVVLDLVSSEVREVDAGMLAVAADPFEPRRPEPEAEEEEVLEEPEEATLSGRELLLELSRNINPTGIFYFGGEYYLVFKEKKKQVGSEIETSYGGSDYSVTVSRIAGSSYSIRLGDAELQIKLK